MGFIPIGCIGAGPGIMISPCGMPTGRAIACMGGGGGRDTGGAGGGGTGLVTGGGGAGAVVTGGGGGSGTGGPLGIAGPIFSFSSSGLKQEGIFKPTKLLLNMKTCEHYCGQTGAILAPEGNADFTVLLLDIHSVGLTTSRNCTLTRRNNNWK